jgi:hypothetical protein
MVESLPKLWVQPSVPPKKKEKKFFSGDDNGSEIYLVLF